MTASAVIEGKAADYNVLGDPRPAVTGYVAQRQLMEGTLAVLVRDIADQVKQYGSIAKIPPEAIGNRSTAL
jgi:PiT family inorganic phosphate transporter